MALLPRDSAASYPAFEALHSNQGLDAENARGAAAEDYSGGAHSLAALRELA